MPSFGRFEIKDSLGNIVTNNPNLKVGNNLFTIDIINEYGEITKTHTLEITRNESSEKSITNVTLMGSDGTNYLTKFDILTTSYAIEVPQNVEFVTLNAVIPAKASATGIGKHSIDLDQTITISLLVTAEDGTTSDT